MANAAAQAGDTVVLSGNFVQQAIAPSHSGTATAPITYQADPAGATLDQPGLVGGTPYMAWFGGRSYITVDGIGFTNSNYVNAPVTNKGVVLKWSSTTSPSTNCSVRATCRCSCIEHRQHNSCIKSTTSWRLVRRPVRRNGQPQTAGDMLNLFVGSNDNEIVGSTT